MPKLMKNDTVSGGGSCTKKTHIPEELATPEVPRALKTTGAMQKKTIKKTWKYDKNTERNSPANRATIGSKNDETSYQHGGCGSAFTNSAVLKNACFTGENTIFKNTSSEDAVTDGSNMRLNSMSRQQNGVTKITKLESKTNEKTSKK